MPKYFALLALAYLAACGSSSAPTPVGDAVNGVWKGSSGSTTMIVDIHSLGETGQILGSGTMTKGSATTSVAIQGALVASDVSLELVGTGYDVYFTGTINGQTMAGSLQGSAAGYTGQQITLSR